MSNLHKEANPAPLGLLGFGMTTVLLNLHNAGLMPLSIVIVAMGIALGGLAQIIAGIFELRNGNTFAGTTFTAYGLFWWSLVLIWVNPFTAAGIEAASKVAMEPKTMSRGPTELIRLVMRQPTNRPGTVQGKKKGRTHSASAKRH